MKTKLNAALLSLTLVLGLVLIAGETAYAQGDIYSVGYSYGRQDRQAGRKKDFKRYSNRYNKYQKNTFKQGYEDGYRDARRNNDDWDDNYGNGNNGNYENNDYGNNRYGSAPPNWMIGTFRGYTPSNNTYTQISVYSNGSISIAAENGYDAANGYYRDGTVYFQWGEYRFKREGNGFRAVNQNNSNDRVYYQRVR